VTIGKGEKNAGVGNRMKRERDLEDRWETVERGGVKGEGWGGGGVRQ